MVDECTEATDSGCSCRACQLFRFFPLQTETSLIRIIIAPKRLPRGVVTDATMHDGWVRCAGPKPERGHERCAHQVRIQRRKCCVLFCSVAFRADGVVLSACWSSQGLRCDKPPTRPTQLFNKTKTMNAQKKNEEQQITVVVCVGSSIPCEEKKATRTNRGKKTVQLYKSWSFLSGIMRLMCGQTAFIENIRHAACRWCETAFSRGRPLPTRAAACPRT